MYLARKRTSQGFRYYLRVSIKEGPFWKAREVVDLGWDPSVYLRYPGGRSFYVDEELEERIRAQGVETDQWELERLFFRFVKPEIREYLYPYVYRHPRKESRPSRKEQLSRQARYHPFDCRRLLFLKLGSANLGVLKRRPFYFLNVLYEKSRDEIEQLIWDREDRLRPREVIPYLYQALGLEKYFSGKLTRHVPEAQLLEDLDRAFLEALCNLARDESYRMGLSEEEVLKEYLSRYVILYFDHTEAQRRLIEERAQGEHFRREVLWRAARYFGLSPSVLRKLSREELLSLFRQKAKELHPDQGGDKEAFIELHEIFEALMKALGFRRRI